MSRQHLLPTTVSCLSSEGGRVLRLVSSFDLFFFPPRYSENTPIHSGHLFFLCLHYRKLVRDGTYVVGLRGVMAYILSRSLSTRPRYCSSVWKDLVFACRFSSYAYPLLRRIVVMIRRCWSWCGRGCGLRCAVAGLGTGLCVLGNGSKGTGALAVTAATGCRGFDTT